jgi:hypothetical protein
MRRVAESAAGWVLVLGTVVPAAARRFQDDGGHLDGVLAVGKVGETIRKFLTE